ncbi:type 2 lantipeptide synthetase LanM family protein [Hazenella sp. IB182353]|uniref:type 2 lanthipeptide synthetase LanM family protein n=1 Tax=Polycladospora coralii TaxID=2771432 RepID=UPI0017465CAF|nr:type 2 lanthipeptide synthetase LanM family protein [Polycladospora coralii]MBS7530593.1 type 2 lantipeptide synthetase LanM family protein [Polycladospora coralii]
MNFTLQRASYIKERKLIRAGNLNQVQDRLSYWKDIFYQSEEYLTNCVQDVSHVRRDELLQLAAYDSDFKLVSTDITEVEKDMNELLSKKYEDVDLPVIENEDEIAFFEFYRPFLQFATYQLQKSTKIPRTLLQSLLLNLTSQLGQISYRTLILELNVARVSDQLEGKTSEQRYTYFCQTYLKDEKVLYALYQEYSVLVRLILKKVKNWVAHIGEILQRYNQDKERIASDLFAGEELGEIKKITLNVGDAHRQGRGVAIILLNTGQQIVYKPRSFQVDIQFQKFMHWINQHMEDENPFFVMKAIDRDTHGWAQFIDPIECKSHEEVRQYYTRMGYTLALLYVLDAVDFHHENMIAHGAFPVLIDLESLFHQQERKKTNLSTAYERASAALSRSVKSTGILPFLIYHRGNPQAKGIDLSGLNSDEEQIAPFKVSQIENRQSDNMKVVKEFARVKAEKNRPMINGQALHAKDYLKQIENGFTKMYIWLMQKRIKLKQRLTEFNHVQVRTIMRDTMDYGNLLTHSYHPDFLRDGLDRDLLFHRLWMATKQRPELKRIVVAEKKDMLIGDVPYFMSKPGERHLWDSEGNRLENFFGSSAMSRVVEKIDSLNEEDCQAQVHIIHMSMLASQAQHDAEMSDICTSTLQKEQAIQAEEYLTEAEKIGDYLLHRAIKGKTGDKEDLCWISTVLYNGDEYQWDISPVSGDLYNGMAGIALFYGYLAKLTGRQDFKDTAIKSLVAIRHTLSKPETLTQFLQDRTVSLGTFTGLSGSLYTLSHLADIWNSDEILQEIAKTLPILIEHIDMDQVYDVIGGVAGTLIVLLRIYKQTNNPLALEGATQCAEHLLKNVQSFQQGVAWKTAFDQSPYTGFSHGTAGVIVALAQLHKIRPDHRFLETIKKALQFERSYFDEKQRNWLTPTKDHAPVAWCHGAPGVLLSRVMLKEAGYQDDLLEQEIEIALDTTLRKGFGNNYSLCHGDFGQLDIIQYAAEVLEKQDLKEIAESVKQQIFINMRETGWDRGISRGVESVGLMTGLSGFGMSLLKYYEPSLVPSILRLQ